MKLIPFSGLDAIRANQTEAMYEAYLQFYLSWQNFPYSVHMNHTSYFSSWSGFKLSLKSFESINFLCSFTSDHFLRYYDSDMNWIIFICLKQS